MRLAWMLQCSLGLKFAVIVWTDTDFPSFLEKRIYKITKCIDKMLGIYFAEHNFIQ